MALSYPGEYVVFALVPRKDAAKDARPLKVDECASRRTGIAFWISKRHCLHADPPLRRYYWTGANSSPVANQEHLTFIKRLFPVF